MDKILSLNNLSKAMSRDGYLEIFNDIHYYYNYTFIIMIIILIHKTLMIR
jgi:hypothetical protein